jgi:hypothetical protein
MINGDGLVQWIMGGGVFVIATFSIATYRYVGKIKEDDERKHSRLYERLDEVKKNNEEKFVFKDICKILHEQTAKDIIEIKSDLKLLLKKNGL